MKFKKFLNKIKKWKERLKKSIEADRFASRSNKRIK